ncbi:30S ribosomal protein S1 [Marichromatium bheemlicum]|uniref:S1 RNA-binding domain-containing protein n=1 Tax=Marichromatium bheemlicum TaxID=365339 RepID=A0ABX1I5S6_9GAMM|nr:S1 RNA-binding domain-containing protein [Marichromatium bheemlicum]NKN32822.1 S1 RNA-binding domain-containing protein [Marichromatium bheemlicum]
MSDTERFADLLQQFDQANPQSVKGEPKVGDPVTGTLIAIDGEYGLVDLGAKSEGRIELAAHRDAEGQLKLAIGDRIESKVSGKDPETGMLLLGAQHGQRSHGLDEVERAYQLGQPVQGQVSGAIKGGLEVLVAGLRGFCPASQVDVRFIEDLSEFVGQRLDFRVTKLEGGRRPNLVLSRRAVLEEAQRIQAEETRAKLVEGAVLSGTVTSLKDYGAFVDLGGIEGMIHVSELAYGHIKHPNEVLTQGQVVEVAVLRIEPATEKRRERIALSIRALARDPWLEVADRHPAGSRVSGKISRLQPFGAFVAIAPGVDGLIHISELGAGRRINDPSEVVKVGDTVEATVIAVDRERKRIKLSLDAERAAEAVVDASAYAPKARKGQGEEKAIGSFGELLKAQLQKD